MVNKINKPMEVVKFEEFGLDEQKAKEITKDLPQIIKERDTLSVQYNEIIKMDIEDPETAKRAGDLRKLIKNNRTKGVEAWHKVNKEYFLRGGQFVDAIKKKEIAENKRMEDALEEIEKHQEILEAKRIEKLNQERIELISPYLEDTIGLQLGSMEEDVFDAYLTAKKNSYEAKIDAERKAEEERLEAERIEKLHQERKELALPYYQFWSDFEKTLNFGEQSDKDFKSFMARNKKAKADYDAEQAKIRAENERLKKEREAEQAKLKAEQEAREEEERKRKEKEEAERKEKEAEIAKYKAKLEAEKKREEERIRKEKKAEDARIKAEQEAKKAPSKEKIRKAVESVHMPELELDDSSKEVYIDICTKFENFKKWADDQVSKM
jgi:hypothetical protein